MLTINVRGLPRSMNESTLEEMFSQYGRVFNLRLAKDLFSGECKGFAELHMEGHEARAAIAGLNGSAHEGAMIQVALHDPKKVRRGRR